MEIIILIFLSMFMEIVDAGLGMGYGTVLSPLLIIMGYNPLLVIPAILLSQSMGGFTATFFHHKHKNAIYTKKSKDLKISLMISIYGILATVLGAFIAININKLILKTYIGVLILLIGILLLSNRKYIFSW